MAKSHRKKATLRHKTVPALGAGVRYVARRAGILAEPARGKKSFDPASVDRMPPFTRKIFPTGKCGRGHCGDAAGLVRVLRGCSGVGQGAAGLTRVLQGCSGAELGAAGVQRSWPGCCRDAAELTRTLRGCSGTGPAAQPGGLPEETRMISVSELDTGRLAASKACVPTRGIDVDALGGRFRRCAGWECRPARAFLSSGRRRSPPASGRSSEHIEEVSGCSAC